MVRHWRALREDAELVSKGRRIAQGRLRALGVRDPQAWMEERTRRNQISDEYWADLFREVACGRDGTAP